MSRAFDGVTRDEYLKLVVEIGRDNAAFIIGLKLGYGNEARLLAAEWLVPCGYTIVKGEE
jgi:hypothetical protein